MTMKYFAVILLLFGWMVGQSQVVKADKELVCPGEEVRLEAKMDNLDFCLQPTGSRFGLFYFRTCRQVTFKDARIIAGLLGGNLATANTLEKNLFIKGMLPNDIHWIGLVQNPMSKTFKDPPDPSSGFEWLSGEAVNQFFWAPGEPNNREDINPGTMVVQGCRRDEMWCDVEPHLRFVAMLESPSPVIPVIGPSSVLWETGETTPVITVRPSKSRYYHVTIYAAGVTVRDSVFVKVKSADPTWTNPGGCGPFLWKPEVKINSPASDYEIRWTFGLQQQDNILTPVFSEAQEGIIQAGLSVYSKSCTTYFVDENRRFDLKYPFQAVADQSSVLKLNEKVILKPVNIGNFLYRWEPPEGLSDASAAQPFFTAKDEISYTVQIDDRLGCLTSEAFHFTIDPRVRLFFPTVFTPNGDGKNDLFQVVFEDGFYGKPRSLEIFDRWGAKVYEIISGAWQWDGTQRGIPAPAGIYQLKLNYLIEGVTVQKSGTFELIR